MGMLEDVCVGVANLTCVKFKVQYPHGLVFSVCRVSCFLHSIAWRDFC